jgi:hypothetical protein
MLLLIVPLVTNHLPICNTNLWVLIVSIAIEMIIWLQKPPIISKQVTQQIATNVMV